MSKIDLETAEIVAANLSNLMNHFDLTPYGVEAGAGVEIHTIAKILRKRTNISTKTARKLSSFFGIPIDALLSSRPLRLKTAENTPTIQHFYINNQLNYKYFQSQQKENIVAQFLRSVLIHDPFLNLGQRARTITNHIATVYNKKFSAKTVAKELWRMCEEGVLEREDRTGHGAVFYYKLKYPIKED